jgi:hypothetical protein
MNWTVLVREIISVYPDSCIEPIIYFAMAYSDCVCFVNNFWYCRKFVGKTGSWTRLLLRVAEYRMLGKDEKEGLINKHVTFYQSSPPLLV